MNAMLFGATPGKEYEDKLRANLDKLDSVTKHLSASGAPVVGESLLTNPSTTYPYRKAVEIGVDMDQEYQDMLSKQSSYSPSQVNMKTSSRKWGSKTTLRNTASHPTFAAESAKIRKSGEENYESALLGNLSDDKPVQYRLGKAMVRKFLRI